MHFISNFKAALCAQNKMLTFSIGQLKIQKHCRYIFFQHFKCMEYNAIWLLSSTFKEKLNISGIQGDTFLMKFQNT